MKKLLLVVITIMAFPALQALSQGMTTNIQYTAGDTVCFTLVARSATGDTIKDWNNTGSTAYLFLHNSTAATDTSNKSWNDNPDGYSWVKLINAISSPVFSPPDRWTLNPGLFQDGVAEFCLISSKADTGVYFEISPGTSALYTVSERMDFNPGPVDNFFVDITSALSSQDAVYLYRKFELLVAPRDQYLNIIREEQGVNFSARWPGEFADGEGLAKLFGGKVFIGGITNYFLAPSATHILPDPNLQWIRVYMEDNDALGTSDPFEVLDHEPTRFFLYNPVDETDWVVRVGSDRPREFTWEHSTDPYSNILISNITNEFGSDEIRYNVIFLDSTSLTKQVEFDSDNLGELTRLSLDDRTMISIVSQIAGGPTASQSMMWLVEATDGLYTRKNRTPDPTRRQPGFHLRIRVIDSTTGISEVPQVPSGIVLHQNYPNPVAAGQITNIKFETTSYGPVLLKVYDMLGSEIATLANESVAPGTYAADFAASGLAPGVYHYTLTAGNRTLTKSLVITK